MAPAGSAISVAAWYSRSPGARLVVLAADRKHFSLEG